MGRWDPVHREHVSAAVREYDVLGRTRFLARYRFGLARSYVLVISGRSYDSKAVLGAAYGYATGSPLCSGDFSGGMGHNGAARVLRRLGFEVVESAETTVVARSASQCAGATAQAGRAEAMDEPDAADVILVGCVKSKHSTAAPARNLYTSPLFKKRRQYAEATGRAWYVISALHGLVDPDAIVEPYEMALSDQSSSYRQQWGARVVRDLIAAVGPLEGRTVEVHAGAAYVDPLVPALSAVGARLRAPLRGLTRGGHLAWYKTHGRASAHAIGRTADLEKDVDHAVAALTTNAPKPASAFPWARTDLRAPGLYAWWVDRIGATELGVTPKGRHTLVYAGQAGATRQPSGTRSNATLFSRISGQHLGGRISSSTFRFTLAALLHDRIDLDVESSCELSRDSERRLSGWMRARLSATVWPVADGDSLKEIEARVIVHLDPPLNLAGAAPTGLRERLTAGRQALRIAPE